MKLLGSTKKDVDSDKNSENVPKLESAEVVLVHCNLVKNDYQHTSKVLFIFVPNKQFGHENMLKVMVFCHLQKSLVINMVKNQWILQLKQEQMLQNYFKKNCRSYRRFNWK